MNEGESYIPRVCSSRKLKGHFGNEDCLWVLLVEYWISNPRVVGWISGLGVNFSVTICRDIVSNDHLCLASYSEQTMRDKNSTNCSDITGWISRNSGKVDMMVNVEIGVKLQTNIVRRDGGILQLPDIIDLFSHKLGFKKSWTILV